MKLTLPEGLSEQDDLQLLLKHSVIESNIPEGSGLGSSAALSVALARCLSTDSQKIFELAKKFEDEFHAGSSGLDVFTSANGGLCTLNNTKLEKLPESLLKKLSKFRFSIIDTKERRKVSEIKSKLNKENMTEFLPEAAKISKEFEDFLSESESEDINKIIRLFDKSHKALVNLKISAPLIDSITSKLKEEFKDDLGIKITGAGGGGCLLLVHNDIVTEELITRNISVNDVKLYYNVKLEN